MSGIVQAFGFIRAAAVSFKNYFYIDTSSSPRKIYSCATTLFVDDTLGPTIATANIAPFGSTPPKIYGNNIFLSGNESHDGGATFALAPILVGINASSRVFLEISDKYVIYVVYLATGSSQYTLTVYINDINTGAAISNTTIATGVILDIPLVYYDKINDSFLLDRGGPYIYRFSIVNNVIQTTTYNVTAQTNLVGYGAIYISKNNNIVRLGYTNSVGGGGTAYSPRMREYDLSNNTYVDSIPTLPVTSFGVNIFWCSINQKYIRAAKNEEIKYSTDMLTWTIAPLKYSNNNYITVTINTSGTILEDSDGKLYLNVDILDSSQKVPPVYTNCVFISNNTGISWTTPSGTFIDKQNKIIGINKAKYL